MLEVKCCQQELLIPVIVGKKEARPKGCRLEAMMCLLKDSGAELSSPTNPPTLNHDMSEN